MIEECHEFGLGAYLIESAIPGACNAAVVAEHHPYSRILTLEVASDLNGVVTRSVVEQNQLPVFEFLIPDALNRSAEITCRVVSRNYDGNARGRRHSLAILERI